VSRPLLLIVHVGKRALLLIFEIAECLRFCICPAEILWRPCPRPSFVFDAVEPSTALEAYEGLRQWNPRLCKHEHVAPTLGVSDLSRLLR
jgi:hypothetical protein